MTTIPTAALNQHIAVLGKTGSGKSYAAKGIVEHLLDQKRQVCVLDPTSAWWGLRLAADGKGRGYDVVLLGGDHADIPLVESALIQFPEGRSREQLTVLTGYKRSTRDAYIQRLPEKGFIDDSSGLVLPTDAGIAALPNAEPLPTGPELQAYWLARLPQGERALLEQLIPAYPQAVDREALTEATGYQRSTRDAYLQRMRAKQLIEEPGRGMVRASANLF
jgi:Predicted ATPase